MATVRFEIQGRPQEITFNAFVTAVRSLRSILAELEVAIAHREAAFLKWVVAELRMGSITIALQSQSSSEDTNTSSEVAHALVSGMCTIEREGRTPPFFSEHAMRCTRRVVNLIGREGMTGIIVADHDQAVQLSGKAAANVRQLLKVDGTAFGSVEGRLETISAYGGSKFTVYHARTGKGVTCVLDNDKLIAQAHAAIGQRVTIIGLLATNECGEPMRVKVQSLKHLPEDGEPPRIEDLGGSDPDFTGDLTTDEYIQHIRGG